MGRPQSQDAARHRAASGLTPLVRAAGEKRRWREQGRGRGGGVLPEALLLRRLLPPERIPG